MSAFDDLVKISVEHFQATTGARSSQFGQGCWWAAYQVPSPPFKDLQALCNHLIYNDKGPFGFPDAGRPTEDADSGRVFAWFPSDQTSRYWHVLLRGFAYCRKTFHEDVVHAPGIIRADAKPGTALLRRSPLFDASDVLDHSQFLSAGPIQVQMGWVGIENRQLTDDGGGTASAKYARSEVIAYAPGDNKAMVIHALTRELYHAFGEYKLSPEQIEQWLREGRCG